ncbi:uncharacterized protein STEHIDRAFT_136350 [Stereum hirsutum FP-91666 SS1]|uniref:uncharacterized protein n=1 Tax=Stereum hirsutum (strain FP-91666) TaxID=721885 RepID=UPI000440F5A1|nr:uncharacterized protein STEHIDRAFT_136350 [Stereum hirsutum FP-91666 SS1]EIM92480.1 hypothetical protein STEHIDRAFT_136350 [Stereum hirsutum FP-91666 SS1]
MPAVRNVRRSRRLSAQPYGHVGTDWDGLAFYPSADSEAPSPLSPPDSAPHTPLAVPLTFREEVLASCAAVASLVTHSSEEYRAIVTTRHGRKRKAGHIPRPPNAFMIYRSHMWSQRKITSTLERDHRNISKIVGHCWNKLDEQQRAPYRAIADEAKRRHAELYPDYKYAPLSRREKAPKRKVKGDSGSEEARCKTVAALLISGIEGVALEDEMTRLSLEAATADNMDGDDSDYAPRKPRKASRSSFSRPSTTRRRSGPVKKVKSRRQIKREVPNTSVIESPVPVQASTPDSVPTNEASSSLSENETGYVSTEAIPPLDLSEATVKAVQETLPANLTPHYVADFIGLHLPALSPDTFSSSSDSSPFLPTMSNDYEPFFDSSSPDAWDPTRAPGLFMQNDCFEDYAGEGSTNFFNSWSWPQAACESFPRSASPCLDPKDVFMPDVLQFD